MHAVGRTGTRVLVPVGEPERLRIGRALDLGAAGVLVPRVETTGEADLAAQAWPYAARRGIGRSSRAWDWGGRDDALGDVDDEIVCAIQIETAGALAAAGEIAAIEGVGGALSFPTTPRSSP